MTIQHLAVASYLSQDDAIMALAAGNIDLVVHLISVDI